MTHFPINKIIRAEYNPRVMPDSEMEALMKSLSTFGFVEPVVLNKRFVGIIPALEGAQHDHGTQYVLVGGHQRLTATERLIAQGNPPKGVHAVSPATETGGAWEVPAVIVELDETQERALNLALNKISGQWDMFKLSDVIASIGNDSGLMPATGFSAEEVADILGGGKSKPQEKESQTCSRCEELRKEISGHERRAGHSVQQQEKQS